MHSIVIIPARYRSSRYPGKPLVKLLGKPMILWVVELSIAAVGRDNVYVATEDERIMKTVTEAGYKAVMTSDAALTGTDRVAEVAMQIDADIYINVQGDEPLASHEDILMAIKEKESSPEMVVNGFCWMTEDEDPENINIPKVITNEKSELIYISRNPLPGFKDIKVRPANYKKQVCIYAFNRAELKEFQKFGRKSALEECEDIEILRFLEIGKRVRMYETKPGSLAVDVPTDVLKVETALRLKNGL